MGAYVVVELGTEPVARSAHPPASALERPEIVHLLSMHHGVVQAAAGGEGGFTTIAVPDMAHAQELAAALRQLDGIHAAYAKPREELP